MDCPKCRGTLARRELSSTVVDECPGCRGVWFDQDELRRAKDAAEPDANWLDFEVWKQGDGVRGSPTSLPCPQCGTPLVALTYADTGVEIDHCPQCEGTWLEHGEFKKIVDALSAEIVTKTGGEYVRAALEEAKELLTGSEGLLSEWRDFTTVLRLLKLRLMVENPKLARAVLNAQRSSPF